MDNSMSKALIMVAGVLIAMLVAAFMRLSFNKIGEWASVQDDEILMEQTDKFNKEFEVYDKDLMYGVDVISCLSKAKSNNDSIEGKYSEQVDSSYAITVQFSINNPLTESITIYHMASDTGKAEKYYNKGEIKKTLKYSEVFNIPTDYSKISYLNSSDFLDIYNRDSKIGEGTYTLNYPLTEGSTIDLLLKFSSNIKQTEDHSSSKYSDRNERSKYDNWTKAIWETPLYDLKTRKFRCTDLTYNAETGRVDSISFEEL